MNKNFDFSEESKEILKNKRSFVLFLGIIIGLGLFFCGILYLVSGNNLYIGIIVSLLGFSIFGINMFICACLLLINEVLILTNKKESLEEKIRSINI